MTEKMAPLLFKLVFLVFVLAVSADDCDNGQIRCNNDDRCIPLRYICDSDNDCDDNSDEDEDLCSAWRNDECERGQVQCRRLGSTTCITMREYCNHNDPPCEGNVDLRICQMLKDNVVRPIDEIKVTSIGFQNNLVKSIQLGEEFRFLMNRTLEHERCPPMYTLIGDQCISLFFVGSVSWGEARAFCQVMEGELMTFRNITQYAAFVGHLREAQITGNFWVGGRFLNDSMGWTWVDDSPMEMGTPYWAVRYKEPCRTRNITYPELEETREANNGECYNYVQAPRDHVLGQCVAISYEHYYYMTDEDCLAKMSPLCVLTNSQPYGTQTLGGF